MNPEHDISIADSDTDCKAPPESEKNFNYDSLEQKDQVDRALFAIKAKSGKTLTDTYDIGERILRIKTEVIGRKNFDRWLKSADWPYAVSYGYSMVQFKLRVDELNLAPLEQYADRLLLDATSLGKLLRPSNASLAKAVVVKLLSGETITKESVEELKELLNCRDSNSDRYNPAETGCYGCFYYRQKAGWRLCQKYNGEKIAALEKEMQLNPEEGCNYRLPKIVEDAKQLSSVQLEIPSVALVELEKEASRLDKPVGLFVAALLEYPKQIKSLQEEIENLKAERYKLLESYQHITSVSLGEVTR